MHLVANAHELIPQALCAFVRLALKTPTCESFTPTGRRASLGCHLQCILSAMSTSWWILIGSGVPQGQADATWIFTGWEGVQARRAGVGLNVFRLRDFGIPYSYPLLLVATEDMLRSLAWPLHVQ